MDKNSLTHHGVKGMRWGIRRFQRKDGSLTAAGKKRRRDAPEEKEAVSEEYTKARAKSVKAMSDSELRSSLNRVQMERQYEQLTTPQKSAGRKLVEGILMDSARQIATPLIAKYSTKGIEKLISMGVKAAKNKQ